LLHSFDLQGKAGSFLLIPFWKSNQAAIEYQISMRIEIADE